MLSFASSTASSPSPPDNEGGRTDTTATDTAAARGKGRESLVTASSAQLTSAIWKMLVAASSLRDGDGQDMKTANRNRRRLALEAIKASLTPW